MGLKFFEFLRLKNGAGTCREVSCRDLLDAAQEFQVRNLCWNICVNMVANAIGRCDFRTFRDGIEVQEGEHWLWNVEPNVNQNSSVFLHKLVSKLYEDNEALIIETTKPNGTPALVVADSWTPPMDYPASANIYRGVTAGEVSYQRSFFEPDVLHLTLHQTAIKPVIDGMYQSYARLLSAAMRHYAWDHGKHWKVHVNQATSGAEGWTDRFQQMITQQIKPFLDSDMAVLPEFDGYDYQDVGGKTPGDSRDAKNLVEDIFDFTARGFLIPAVLVNGKIEGTADATARFLTNCIDPLCDQLQEEINRKRYGYDAWRRGSFIRVDSSAIQHFDIFANAPNVEKLVGSGAFSINDVLRAAGYPPINEPWADQHFLTKNISDLQSAAAALEAQKGETE